MKKRLERLFSLLVAALFFSLIVTSVVHASLEKNRKIDLIYSGNLDGELEPCGCAVGSDLGGILRRATVLDDLRAKEPGLFVISAGGLISSFSVHDHLTAEYILKGIAALSYDAIGVQWQDLAYGADFINQDALPWVTTNGAAIASLATNPTFPRYREVVRDGVTLAFFSWLNPHQSPLQGVPGSQDTTTQTTGIAASLKRANNKGALTVLSTTLSADDAARLLPLENVDILIVKSAYEVYGEPQKIGNTLVIRPGSRGMRLGRLTLTLNTSGAITAHRHSVIELPDAIADAPRLHTWYQAYNERIKQDYLAEVALRKSLRKGKSAYAGAESCRSCHQHEYEVWSKSDHSGAYESLEAVNKSFDPGCIGCHTVAYGKAGGFISIDLTDTLSGVQCESCHGAAAAHATNPAEAAVANREWAAPKMCAQCHVQKHSPDFNFDRYWPHIRHPLR
ncbi:MAG: hypothetical protein GXP10_07880 [Gammaproteobacteria bacterium]|nr:hypothetical protein [Gammaproteobacteria bacterium]